MNSDSGSGLKKVDGKGFGLGCYFLEIFFGIFFLLNTPNTKIIIPLPHRRHLHPIILQQPLPNHPIPPSKIIKNSRLRLILSLRNNLMRIKYTQTTRNDKNYKNVIFHFRFNFREGKGYQPVEGPVDCGAKGGCCYFGFLGEEFAVVEPGDGAGA